MFQTRLCLITVLTLAVLCFTTDLSASNFGAESPYKHTSHTKSFELLHRVLPAVSKYNSIPSKELPTKIKALRRSSDAKSSNIQEENSTKHFNKIETYRLDEFPEHLVSMHMPCVESEEFATNCACHIKCTSRNCQNAKDICYRYRDKGCAYVLLRGPPEKQLATLKRLPTVAEREAFDISGYPTTVSLLEDSAIWQKYLKEKSRAKVTATEHSTSRGPMLGDYLAGPFASGARARDTLIALMQEGPRSEYCLDTSAKNSSWKESFLSDGISLVALSYRTPHSLVNSMRTWRKSGLLDWVQEKRIILNDPLPQVSSCTAVNRCSQHLNARHTGADLRQRVAPLSCSPTP
jgi:hypothetical protein